MFAGLLDQSFNTLRPKQDGRHFADDIFKCIFLNESVCISLKISLKFIRKVRINNIPTLFQIMACRRPDDKPLSETIMVSLSTKMCVTWSQWGNTWDQTLSWGKRLPNEDVEQRYLQPATFWVQRGPVIRTELGFTVTNTFNTFSKMDDLESDWT